MLELCVRMNTLGVIQKVYTDSASIIKPNNHLLFNLFDNDFKNKLIKNINDPQDRLSFAFFSHGETYYAYALVHLNQIYLYLVNSQPNIHSVNLIHQLLESRAKEIELQNKPSDTESNGLFENMQKLNNELINKGRQIEKMNQQLNRLNTLLNNRLVSDPLTHLVSRYQYTDEVMLAINKFPDLHSLFCFIDIDNFKAVNDTYGHHLGDIYLVEFAQRLNLLPFENCVKMRIAGDEFGLFIYGLEEINEQIVSEIWNIFKSVVIKPITINGIELDLSVSLGIALHPDNTKDIHLLIDYADESMYIAKKSGKNRYHLYSKDN